MSGGSAGQEQAGDERRSALVVPLVLSWRAKTSALRLYSSRAILRPMESIR
jgi:hypothetical protein